MNNNMKKFMRDSSNKFNPFMVLVYNRIAVKSYLRFVNKLLTK